jgi:hypothetical protein
MAIVSDGMPQVRQLALEHKTLQSDHAEIALKSSRGNCSTATLQQLSHALASTIERNQHERELTEALQAKLQAARDKLEEDKAAWLRSGRRTVGTRLWASTE